MPRISTSSEQTGSGQGPRRRSLQSITSMSAPYDVRAVEYLGRNRQRLTLADGLGGEVDLAALRGGEVGPVFEALPDQAVFAEVRVDAELGTVTWPNGADLAPDVLHREAVPVWHSRTSGPATRR